MYYVHPVSSVLFLSILFLDLLSPAPLGPKNSKKLELQRTHCGQILVGWMTAEALWGFRITKNCRNSSEQLTNARCWKPCNSKCGLWNREFVGKLRLSGSKPNLLERKLHFNELLGWLMNTLKLGKPCLEATQLSPCMLDRFLLRIQVKRRPQVSVRRGGWSPLFSSQVFQMPRATPVKLRALIPSQCAGSSGRLCLRSALV